MEPAAREPGFKGWLSYIWAEGLARKVIVTREGRTYVHLPLTVVVIGAALAPWLAALGLVVAVVAGCSLSVEREAESEPDPEPAEDAPATNPAAAAEEA